MLRRGFAAGAGAVLLLGLAATPALAAPPTGGPGGPPPGPSFPTVATGLDNPRGLAFAPDGDLYIAEAGHGGKAPCIPSDDDPTVNTCFGTTGAITRVHDGKATQVVTGLPSLAPQVATQGGHMPPGAQATGPSDVAVTGTDKIVFTIGLGSNPANRDSTFVPVSPLGHLLGTLAGSSVPSEASAVTMIGDVAAFEGANDPVPGPKGPDSNANAVLPVDGGYAVVDAGANDLLHVDTDGSISLIATFPSAKECPPPPIKPESVPTSVVRGPDGALYVSELTGFPFCEGGASIFKVENGEVSVYATGLTNVTGLEFGPDGTLYVVEIAQHGLQKGPIGAVVAIPKGGGKSLADYRMVAAGLMAPYGIAIRGDSAYVTTGSVLPATAGGGSVVKIPLSATVPTSSAAPSPTSTSTAAPTSSAAPTSTWSVLPGSTGDALPPSRDTGVVMWVLAGLLVALGGALLVGRRGRRRANGRHA